MIEGFDYVPKLALGRVCSICNKKNGICVQCYAVRSAGKRCTTTFHVGCAKREPKYRVEMIYARSITGDDGWDVAKVCFCADHAETPFDEARWASEQRIGMELEKNDPTEYWKRVKAGKILEATSTTKLDKKTTAASKKKSGAGGKPHRPSANDPSPPRPLPPPPPPLG